MVNSVTSQTACRVVALTRLMNRNSSQTRAAISIPCQRVLSSASSSRRASESKLSIMELISSSCGLGLSSREVWLFCVFDHFLETPDFGWSDVFVFEKIYYEQFRRIVEKTFEQIANHALLRLLAINQWTIDKSATLLLVLDIALLLQDPHHRQNRAVRQSRVRQRFDDFRNCRLPLVPEHVHQLKLDFGQRWRFPASHLSSPFGPNRHKRFF